MESSFLFQAFIYLLAAVISVPIAKRLGLGSVLGYLIAGMLIGPFVFGLVGKEQEEVMHFAEFGVVMMLFLVGLELKPSTLWKMRGPILGRGGAQMLITAAIIAFIASFFGQTLEQSIAIGMILGLSSTAIVLQTLTEKGWMKRQAGQSGFAVLLFQDIAVIPMLAILPLLAIRSIQPVENELQANSLIEGLSPELITLIVFGVLAAIIIAGRYLVRPVFRVIAETRQREIFTAAALLLVIGITVAMPLVGLSPALGTFTAGVVLADSEYRHQLESDIEPFKGLLLGLFFISVGASIDFNLFFSSPFVIIGLVFGLIFIKFCVLYMISRSSNMASHDRWIFALILAQGSEFAFVLFSFASQQRVLSNDVTDTLIVVTAVSMLFTPLLMIFYDKWILPRLEIKLKTKDQYDEINDPGGDVILAGFGRFGTVVGRMLLLHGFKVTVLDYDPKQVALIRKFGFKVFYGDATRVDLLKSAGADEASLLIIAIDDEEKITELTKTAKEHFPHLTIMARAHDRNHVYKLLDLGLNRGDIVRECYSSSLDMGKNALNLLGFGAARSYQAMQRFDFHDRHLLHDAYDMRSKEDDKVFQNWVKQQNRQIEDLLRKDEEDDVENNDHSWQTAKPNIKKARRDQASR